MRIDFNAEFSKIRTLIGATAAPIERKGGALPFEQALQSAQVQQSEITSQKANYSGSTMILPEPKAALRMPELPPISASSFDMALDPLPAVKETESSVKTSPRNEDFSRLNETERRTKVASLVTAAGKEFGIDPMLSLAVATAESSLDPTALSNDGHESKGLFQLLDKTGLNLHERAGLDEAYDPYDPDQNVHLGVKYLRHLHDTFSQPTKLPNEMTSVQAANSAALEKLAVAAFNAGEGRVASAQSRASRGGADAAEYDQIASYLPKTTQEYVVKVMELKRKFESGLK